MLFNRYILLQNIIIDIFLLHLANRLNIICLYFKQSFHIKFSFRTEKCMYIICSLGEQNGMVVKISGFGSRDIHKKN